MHTLTEEKKKQFAGLYLLERMINRPESFPLYLEKHDKDLEPILEYLLTFEYIDIKEDKDYIPTAKGREIIKQFLARYQDFLKHFDIYSAVDLGEGSFAFEAYWDIESEAQWQSYISDNRWEDLRIAVAEFKQIDPVEIVFMSFLYEDRFGWSEDSGWQFDLLLGSIWDQILDIVNSALKQDDLDYEMDGEKVSGEAVLKDVIIQGAELNKKLWSEEDDRDSNLNYHDQGPNDPNEDFQVDPVRQQPVESVVYDRYMDPYYINPCWAFIFFI